MTLHEIRKKLGYESVSEFNVFLAEIFQLKNSGTFENSSARKRYESAFVKIFNLGKRHE